MRASPAGEDRRKNNAISSQTPLFAADEAYSMMQQTRTEGPSIIAGQLLSAMETGNPMLVEIALDKAKNSVRALFAYPSASSWGEGSLSFERMELLEAIAEGMRKLHGAPRKVLGRHESEQVHVDLLRHLAGSYSGHSAASSRLTANSSTSEARVS